MPFPRESFEQVFSNICDAGRQNDFIVVPQFTMWYAEGRKKIIDVAWLVPHGNEVEENGLPLFRVVAAFEVEGFNVPLSTIRFHLKVYKSIAERYGPIPCYVPFYSKAVHRPSYGQDEDAVEDRIDERKHMANSHQSLVTLCDARARDWLPAAVTLANQLRDEYLQ